jgi:PAS domain S-box-containing protein
MRAASLPVQILVVEDERIVAKDITSSLERLGYGVTGIASSGEEAIRMVESRPPDLILMDVVLKGEVDGIDAAEKIRGRYDVPVIYLTAYADTTTLERAKGTFPYGYLLKPWQERELRTVIEIALHKHTLEQRLKESERWLSMTLASIGDAVVATNEQGTIVLMNHVAESITGWRRGDAVGRDAAQVVRIGRRAGNGEALHPLTRALQVGAAVSLASDFSLVARDGRVVDVGDSAAPIKDEKGNVKGAVLVFRDVTERKRADEAQAQLNRAVEAAAAEWRLTFDAIQSPVILLDLDGRVLRMNAAAQQLAGRPYELCVGALVGSLGVVQPWPEAALVAQRVRRDQIGYQCQVNDPTTGRTWDLTGSPGSGPEHEGRVILIANDITRLMELQHSLRRSETMSAMGALVAGVAHEARNPLFGISANLDALEARTGAATAQDETIVHMRQALNRLSSLMQQLLDYGKPPTPQFGEGSLADVMAEVADACRPLAERASVRVENAVGPALPMLRMDRHRLVQLFENLVENAVQHSPADGTVAVDATVVTDDGRTWIECRVTDHGPGFPGDDLRKVFEPFFTRRRGGTGLGLSIVQRIVQEHGGRIEARNRDGGGAMMIVRLPAAQ